MIFPIDYRSSLSVIYWSFLSHLWLNYQKLVGKYHLISLVHKKYCPTPYLKRTNESYHSLPLTTTLLCWYHSFFTQMVFLTERDEIEWRDVKNPVPFKRRRWEWPKNKSHSCLLDIVYAECLSLLMLNVTMLNVNIMAPY